METGQSGKATARQISGSDMDRPVTRRRGPWRWALPAVLLAALLATGWLLVTRTAQRSLVVAENRLVIAEVRAGTFEDVTPLRARVAPLQTVYLDAVKGGRVEQVLVEDGASVEPGQPIARLSNADLQLSVMNTESRVMEQLNTMRDQELRLEQNRLAHKQTLVEVEYQIRRLDREIDRRRGLLASGHASQSDFEDLNDELRYYRARRALTLESQASDERLMAQQLAFYEDNAAMMEHNLTFARKSLDELDVRAPVGGKLSGFDLAVGQTVAPGARIGQVDNADAFKLVANIDEFYLSRVHIGQLAEFEHRGHPYQMTVSKIYPNVEAGQFEVDLQFVGTQPAELRRGQSMQARLTLGDASDAVLIPQGSFYQDTGGRWIFVVSPGGERAIRRPVTLGRRNSDYIEVLDGLQPGEQVIVSPYTGFRDMEKLELASSADRAAR